MYQPEDLANQYNDYGLDELLAEYEQTGLPIENDFEDYLMELSFTDTLGKGLKTVGNLGNKIVDSGREILTPIKKTWKENDPDSYNKVKKLWRTPGNAIKDFRQGGGFDAIADAGNKMTSDSKAKSLEDLMAEYGISADDSGMPITPNMQSLS